MDFIEWWADLPWWARYGVGLLMLAISAGLLVFGHLVWFWGWGAGLALLLFAMVIPDP
jgi:hypothetical protein